MEQEVITIVGDLVASWFVCSPCCSISVVHCSFFVIFHWPLYRPSVLDLRVLSTPLISLTFLILNICHSYTTERDWTEPLKTEIQTFMFVPLYHSFANLPRIMWTPVLGIPLGIHVKHIIMYCMIHVLLLCQSFHTVCTPSHRLFIVFTWGVAVTNNWPLVSETTTFTTKLWLISML